MKSARICRWVLVPALFFTFCAGQCSSKRKPAEETKTAFLAGKSAPAVEGKAEAAGHAADKAPEEAAGAPPSAENKEKKEKKPGTLVLAAGGDVIFHGRVKSTADHQAASPSEEDDSKHEGWWHIFKRLGPVLEGTDVALANLECPIAKERKKAMGKPPVLNGPPAAVEAMKEAGFNVLIIANNHAFDQMREGVQETYEAVKEAGAEVVGGGPDRKTAEGALVKEIGGVKAAFFAWTVTLNKNFNDVKTDHKPWIAVYTDEGAKEKIAAVRPAADLVVVSMHWGGEFEMKAGSKEKTIARKLCAAGADIVIGHGPHILHSVEWVEAEGGEGRKCLVAYSLGNLLSNQGLKYRYGWTPPNLVEAKNIPYTRDGIILRITVSKKEGGVVFDGIEAVPIWTENNWIERYAQKVIPPDDIFIVPIVPYLESVQDDQKLRLLLEERLAAIKEMVGSAVTYVDL
jgi:hypothetical protein